jgi:ribonuclease BN (tRNA processing enzyme)
MELTVLGCQAGMPASGPASSGYIVSTDGARILLDCGPGIAAALSGHGGGAAGLDAIVISHVHADHCYDLLPVGIRLLRSRPLPLYLPAGGTAVLAALAGVFPLRGEERGTPFHHGFVVHEYQPGETVHIGDCAVTFHLLRHAVPNCGVRVDDGTATLAYTGDTGPTPALADLARGAGLLLAECTLATPEEGDHGHLCATDAARVAADAGVRQLVLTHFGSAHRDWVAARRSEASRVFGGRLRVAYAGATFRVPATRA